MVIEADIPDGLAQIFTQHLLGFEAAHAGCRFAVRSKTEMPVSETAQTPDIANAELAAAQKRISEQSERIAELYRVQKNSFLSLRTSGRAEMHLQTPSPIETNGSGFTQWLTSGRMIWRKS
jgi:hypothetical protein